MTTASISELCALPLDYRLQLVESLWDSIAEDADHLPMPAWHKSVLDARLDSADPSDEGKDWNDKR